MRIYEELFVLKPDATEEEVDAVYGQLESVIKQGGGKVEKTDKWGVRRLAYKVNKYSEGYYVLLSFHSKPETVKEVERRLRVSDLVLKHLTVRMDEKLKWLEKRKKAREARAAKKPAPVPAAAPGAPGAPAPGAPGPVPGAPVPAAAPAAPVETNE